MIPLIRKGFLRNSITFLKNNFIITLVFILFLVTAVYFIFTDSPISNTLCNNFLSCLLERVSLADEPLNIRSLLVGIVALIGLYFLDIRTKDQVQKTKLETKRRLDERFDSAVNALSKPLTSDSYPAHLGAISSLTQLAIDGPGHTQRCLDVLCSCNEWMEDHLGEFSNYARYVEEHRGKDNLHPGKSIPYPQQHINTFNRMVFKQVEGNIVTILQEKRSQRVLNAIREILIKIPEDNLKSLDFRHRFLCGIDLSELSGEELPLKGINFSQAYLNGSFIKKANLECCNLQNANLQGCAIEFTNLKKADLRSAKLININLVDTELESANLRNTKLHGAYVSFANLAGVNFKNAELQNVELCQVNMEGVDFSYANLQGIQILPNEQDAPTGNLCGATIFKTKMQLSYLLNIDMCGAMLLSSNTEGSVLEEIKLGGSIIEDSNLSFINYRSVSSDHLILKKAADRNNKLSQNDLDKLANILLNPVYVSGDRGRLAYIKDKVMSYQKEASDPLRFTKFLDNNAIQMIDCYKNIKENIKLEEVKKLWLKVALENSYTAVGILRNLRSPQFLFAFLDDSSLNNEDDFFNSFRAYLWKELKRAGKSQEVEDIQKWQEDNFYYDMHPSYLN